MKKGFLVKLICGAVCLSALFTVSAVTDDTPPGANITNGMINVHLYLPDVDKGYYRAMRFDWSGVISDLQYKGHSYYGQWYQKYDPLINDAIMGPVEAFDPIGFDAAKPGDSFVKVGVGVLEKPDDQSYNFQRTYKILNNGNWKVKTAPNQVIYQHSLTGKEYAYEYSKTIKLIKDKPVMILSHTLKNTGTKAIETAVFNHNFLVMDHQPTGPGFEVTFPLNPNEKMNARMEDYAKLQDNKLIFLKELDRRNVSFKDLTNGDGADYRLQVENHVTGAGVKITGDRPISKMVFWSASKTLCPEPYINIKIEPGKTFTWNITYEFYEAAKNQ